MANQHPILAKSFIIRIGIGVSAGTDPVANHIQLPQTLSPKIPATRDRSPCILTVLGSWSIAASPTSAYLTRPTLSRVLQSIDSAVALPSVGPLGPLALCASLLFPLRDLPEREMEAISLSGDDLHPGNLINYYCIAYHCSPRSTRCFCWPVLPQ